MMHKHLKFFPFILFSPALLAQEVIISAPKPLFFEQQPDFGENAPRAADDNIHAPPLLLPEQLSGNQLEDAISQALVARQWQQLSSLLARYQQQSDYDVILYRYAKGALLRAQKNYSEAISLYRQIVQDKPELAYPRFDLGLMLFENKQYGQAQTEIEQAASRLAPNIQPLARRYLQSIEAAGRVQYDFSLQYVRTNNVNNASSQREFQFNGVTFIKTPESLPQKAQGLRYGLGASQSVNLGGNHFFSWQSSVNGVYYWDNQEYSEKSLYLSAGYQYQSALNSFSVLPFWEQNWLGAPRYNQNFGFNLLFSQELALNWRISNRFSHTQKRYADSLTAQRYNGYANGLGSTLYYSPDHVVTFFAGVELNRDLTRDKSESSNKRGGNVGIIARYHDLGLRLSGGYSKRDFRANHFYAQNRYKRQDKETRFNAALWHNKLQYFGFVPKINYQYRRINSNIAMFYSRSSAEWFLTVEKAF